MSYTLDFLSLASLDVKDAYLWYEEKKRGLGDKFIKYLDERLAKIKDNPHLFQERYRGVHKVRVKKFPYSIHYIIQPDNRILVTAVHHFRRDEKGAQERV